MKNINRDIKASINSVKVDVVFFDSVEKMGMFEYQCIQHIYEPLIRPGYIFRDIPPATYE